MVPGTSPERVNIWFTEAYKSHYSEYHIVPEEIWTVFGRRGSKIIMISTVWTENRNDERASKFLVRHLSHWSSLPNLWKKTMILYRKKTCESVNVAVTLIDSVLWISLVLLIPIFLLLLPPPRVWMCNMLPSYVPSFFLTFIVFLCPNYLLAFTVSHVL